MLVGGLAAGLFLGSEPELWRFTAIFLVAVFGVFVRAALIAGLPEESAPISPGPAVRSFASLFVPLCDPAMLRFAVLIFLVQGVLWASHPLYTPYLSTALNYPASTVVVALAALSLGKILLGGAIGRMADKLSFHRMVVLGGLLGAAAIGTVIALPPANLGVVSLALGVGVFVIIGVAETVLGLAIMREQFARAPELHASENLGLSNAVTGKGGAAGGLVGGLLPKWLGFLGDSQTALRWAFAPIAILLLIIAGGLMFVTRPIHQQEAI